MSLIVRICLILFGIAYLISPIDIIPDLLLPYVGWIDDGAVFWGIYHLIRYGKLPWSDKKRNFSKYEKTYYHDQTSESFNSEDTKNNSHESGHSHSKKTSLSAAYKILGLRSNANWQEIQTAYRNKSKKYHPDRVSHLGKEFSELANKKFIEIQKAYELLKYKKGH